MQEVTLIIRHKTGFHLRPAGAFARTAKKFSSTITVTKNEHQANAKSVVNLLTLGAGKGAEITIRATGPDELEAVKTLQELVESNFESPDKLPPPPATRPD